MNSSETVILSHEIKTRNKWLTKFRKNCVIVSNMKYKIVFNSKGNIRKTDVLRYVDNFFTKYRGQTNIRYD